MTQRRVRTATGKVAHYRGGHGRTMCGIRYKDLDVGDDVPLCERCEGADADASAVAPPESDPTRSWYPGTTRRVLHRLNLDQNKALGECGTRVLLGENTGWHRSVMPGCKRCIKRCEARGEEVPQRFRGPVVEVEVARSLEDELREWLDGQVDREWGPWLSAPLGDLAHAGWLGGEGWLNCGLARSPEREPGANADRCPTCWETVRNAVVADSSAYRAVALTGWGWPVYSRGTYLIHSREPGEDTTLCGRNAVADLTELDLRAQEACDVCLNLVQAPGPAVMLVERAEGPAPNETRGEDGETPDRTIARLRRQNQEMGARLDRRASGIQSELDGLRSLFARGEVYVNRMLEPGSYESERTRAMVTNLLGELTAAHEERDAFRDRMHKTNLARYDAERRAEEYRKALLNEDERVARTVRLALFAWGGDILVGNEAEVANVILDAIHREEQIRGPRR